MCGATMLSALFVACVAKISAASNLDACSATDGSCPVNHADPSGTLAMQVKIAPHDSKNGSDVVSGWVSHEGLHCGGSDIKTWTNGTTAHYGPSQGEASPEFADATTNLPECRKICEENSDICAGFVHRWGARHADGICSFWKAGPLDMYSRPGHTCWQRDGETRKDPVPDGWNKYEDSHCGGSDITTWKDGSNAHYGPRQGKDSDEFNDAKFDVNECQQICEDHSDCAGFVHRWGGKHKDGICSFWKEGPLERYAKEGHTCWERSDGGNRNGGDDDFELFQGKHCGGESIKPKWKDGKRSEYGDTKWQSIDECKQVCRDHPDCDGFVHRPQNNPSCGFWKSGPFSHNIKNQLHHCYVKKK